MAKKKKIEHEEIEIKPKKKRWKKRTWVSIVIALFVIALIARAVFFGGEDAPVYDTFTLEKREVAQIVNVTGRVKPADFVELTFEQGGNVSTVNVEVGDRVVKGDVLAGLSSLDAYAQLAQANASLQSARAQLSQYEAARDFQKVKLDQLTTGSREEEILIARTTVAQAEQTRANAEVSLAAVQAQASINIFNLYDDIPSLLQDVYTDADDAMRSKIEELFTDSTTNPQLTFTVNDFETELLTESGRKSAGIAHDELQNIIGSLSSEGDERVAALNSAKTELLVLQSFFGNLTKALSVSIGLVQATLDSYQTDVNTARTNIVAGYDAVVQKQQGILVQKATNAKTISDADSVLRSAESALISANADLDLTLAGTRQEELLAQEAQLKQAEANIAVQWAAIKQAQATVLERQARLAKFTIKSPIEGVVTKIDVEVGENIAASASVITVQSDSKYEVEAFIPEVDVAKILVGQSADITLDAYGRDAHFASELVSIDPAETLLDSVSTYRIILYFSEDDERIKSGMTANIDVYGEKREGVLAVPQRTLIRKEGDQFVRILKNDEPVDVSVTTGLRGSDGFVEIMSGLEEGVTVIRYIAE